MLVQFSLVQVRFVQVKFDDVSLVQVRFVDVRLGQVRLGQVSLGQVRLGFLCQLRLGIVALVQLIWVMLCQVRLIWISVCQVSFVSGYVRLLKSNQPLQLFLDPILIRLKCVPSIEQSHEPLCNIPPSYNCCPFRYFHRKSPNIFRVTKSIIIERVVCLARTGYRRGVYIVFVGKPQ